MPKSRITPDTAKGRSQYWRSVLAASITSSCMLCYMLTADFVSHVGNVSGFRRTFPRTLVRALPEESARLHTVRSLSQTNLTAIQSCRQAHVQTFEKQRPDF